MSRTTTSSTELEREKYFTALNEILETLETYENQDAALRIIQAIVNTTLDSTYTGAQ